MRALWQDLAHASRAVLRSRGFTVTAALTLALGIGAVTALTSVLERHEMVVRAAENGQTALDLLREDADMDIVLMDIMMPEMDGLTAMRAIRERPEWDTLPIIALTAKAMKNDQEQALAAGANDYMAKPLDVDQLLSLVRVWMPR